MLNLIRLIQTATAEDHRLTIEWLAYTYKTPIRELIWKADLIDLVVDYYQTLDAYTYS